MVVVRFQYLAFHVANDKSVCPRRYRETSLDGVVKGAVELASLGLEIVWCQCESA